MPVLGLGYTNRVLSSPSRVCWPWCTAAAETAGTVRNNGTAQLVSQALFDPMPPQPAQYIAACENIFQTHLFQTLARMIHENGTGASYVQQVLDMSPQDAMALHEELRV